MTLEYAPNVVSNILQRIKDYTTTNYHIEILQHSLCQARLSPRPIRISTGIETSSWDSQHTIDTTGDKNNNFASTQAYFW